MAKTMQSNGMIRLLVYVGVILLAAAIMWGAVRHNVTDNSEAIVEIKTVTIPKLDRDKLDKEVFQMYLDQEQVADDKSDAKLNRIETKLDKALEK